MSLDRFDEALSDLKKAWHVIDLAMDQYLEIIINTIFRKMNFHLPAILMWTTGVQGFDLSPFQKT